MAKLSDGGRCWIAPIAAPPSAIAGAAERELAALVGVSSPSGDSEGAEEAVAIAIAMLPAEASFERVPCSSPGHADDLLARLAGTGTAVCCCSATSTRCISHDDHRPLERRDDLLYGAGTIDMKGGVALALGVLRALAGCPERFAEVALLLVNDEEWRRHDFVHGPRFAGFDACLCFEGGELDPADGDEAVVVDRKAAAHGPGRGRRAVAAHSGSNPDDGRNALLALGGGRPQRRRAPRPRRAPSALTVVPTDAALGRGVQRRPRRRRALVDLRADDLAAIEPVLAAVPDEVDGSG